MRAALGGGYVSLDDIISVALFTLFVLFAQYYVLALFLPSASLKIIQHKPCTKSILHYLHRHQMILQEAVVHLNLHENGVYIHAHLLQ